MRMEKSPSLLKSESGPISKQGDICLYFLEVGSEGTQLWFKRFKQCTEETGPRHAGHVRPDFWFKSPSHASSHHNQQIRLKIILKRKSELFRFFLSNPVFRKRLSRCSKAWSVRSSVFRSPPDDSELLSTLSTLPQCWQLYKQQKKTSLNADKLSLSLPQCWQASKIRRNVILSSKAL